MTVEGDSGGDPEDLDGDRVHGEEIAGDRGLDFEAHPGDNGLTVRLAVGTRGGFTISTGDLDPDEGRRLLLFDNHEGNQKIDGGRCSNTDTGQIVGAEFSVPRDKNLKGNRSVSAPLRQRPIPAVRPGQRGQWGPRPRRPRIPVVLDLRRRSAEQLHEIKVRSSGNLGDKGGLEDEDGEWTFVGDRGDRVKPNPAEDLRPIGTKSKFWLLEDDDDTDEEIVSQSPFTPDLVRQAAVHGFTKDQLVEAEGWKKQQLRSLWIRRLHMCVIS